ncbi:MAG: dihydroneopterin aldolase [Vicinamibacteria bacterium]|nr:dihydroneopterin aldolase [Vicinamibacteria bacterium]
MDRILIRDLQLRCIIGVEEFERREKQDVVIQIALAGDFRRAARSDDFADAADYRAIKKRVVALVEASRFRLVEALAEAVAAACLEDERLAEVTVLVEKPGSLRFARTVGVEMTRQRGDE